MELEHKLVVERLSKILDGLLLPASANVDNVFLESLITHLAAKENIMVLQEPILCEWVKKCVSQIEADFESVNSKIISFMLKLCGILATNEWIMLKLTECKVIKRIWEMIERNTNQFNAGTKLATINMLTSIAQYSFGTIYMRMIKAWRILIDYCNSEHIYVVREAQKLLYQLLYNFSVKTKDEELLIEMLGEILQPILTSVYDESEGRIQINVEDSEEQRKLSKTLDLASYIFQTTLKSKEKTNIVDICLTRYNLGMSLWKMFEFAYNVEFVGKILNTMSSCNFGHLIFRNWNTQEIPPENFTFFGLLFFNQIKFTLTRCDCTNFLKLVNMYHVLWKRLGQRAPKVIQIDNQRVCFEQQLVVFHTMPLFHLLQSKEIIKLEAFDDFVQQIFDSSCEQTQRLCYTFRDVCWFIKESSISHVTDLAYKSVHSILSLANKLEREHAVFVFKAMIYPLHDLVLYQSEYSSVPKNNSFSLDETHKILYIFLFGLRTLIERHNISWKESLETIGLVNCVGWLLESSNLPTRLIVQGLKLIQLSIEHFLSPNMALLVNSLDGSGLVRLGPMIIKLVNDEAWDARDSVVELVACIAEISRNMFPAFQQFLITHKICPVIYDMAKNDSEPYVRASAFKCLTNFVSINLIWENEFKNMDIIEHIFNVLYIESEAIVRREAVNTLLKIYEYRKIPTPFVNIFYSTIAHCTIMDLHWEVKVNALNFWKLEIQRQFTHQGMIDGTFPTVTFSKESRKIVTLTEKEINIRIIKALNELSQRGCFGIILKCLTEECDLEVIKTAINIVRDLLEMLDKYNYETVLINGPQYIEFNKITLVEPDIHKFSKLAVKDGVCPSSDSVIDDILNTDDFHLLTIAHEQQMDIDKKEQKIDETYFIKFTNISTKNFINIVKNTNFEQLLHKNEWLLTDQSFISIIDDIICVLNPDDTKSIVHECY